MVCKVYFRLKIGTKCLSFSFVFTSGCIALTITLPAIKESCFMTFHSVGYLQSVLFGQSGGATSLLASFEYLKWGLIVKSLSAGLLLTGWEGILGGGAKFWLSKLWPMKNGHKGYWQGLSKLEQGQTLLSTLKAKIDEKK